MYTEPPSSVITVLVTCKQNLQLTSNEVPTDEITYCSISNIIYWSDLELIYHTGAGVIVHCKVELWDVDVIIGFHKNIIHTDFNTIPDVKDNSSYVQTRWGIPSETDNLTKRFTSEVTDSIKQACRRYRYAHKIDLQCTM